MPWGLEPVVHSPFAILASEACLRIFVTMRQVLRFAFCARFVALAATLLLAATVPIPKPMEALATFMGQPSALRATWMPSAIAGLEAITVVLGETLS